MQTFLQNAKNYKDPERLAQDYLQYYFQDRTPSYPLNPFQMLVDAGVLFNFRPFNNLEGVYVAAEDANDISIVGININRPIARQRFTAAHEFCHHIHDSETQVACLLNSKDPIEKFADSFAAAILMPLDELKKQVQLRLVNGCVSFDAVLDVSDYFGVSFESCLYRIAYRLHAISGDTNPKELRKRIHRYKPQIQRTNKGLNDLKLYEDLIDSFDQSLQYTPSDHVKLVFQNDYIYNDSRMEGVDISHEEASEIVTDLRIKKQNSVFCEEKNEAFMSIAGHYEMYQSILATPIGSSISVFNTVSLNRALFSCYPHPEFGGAFRSDNAVVMGAKIETTPYSEICARLATLDSKLKSTLDSNTPMSTSQYIECATRVHHQLTVIHPYADGNGRTLRAFFNVMLISGNITPIYITVDKKPEYIKALEKADTEKDYIPLYEFMFKTIIKCNSELSN